MKVTGWVLLALSGVLLLLAVVQQLLAKPTNDPTGDMAEMLGRFACPATLLVPALLFLLIGHLRSSRDLPVARPVQPPPQRNVGDGYDVVDE